ncbi:hypothetical protein [Tumebacillus permanentifrigoris]|uniref:Uncharacterized protein n=1 Tax=Tumebacillus permanentifrigoris TaxID=378543 RepID=A0A316DDX1_9BACL|nr:hypothetical protein [Tumebacillus permanentifrigoris]PWK16427.1 hypothetical protein C7459_101291 [Tumebacillus permanentifrigoris]
MKKPSEPKYVATGALAKKILQDLQTPASEKELRAVRKAIASRKERRT